MGLRYRYSAVIVEYKRQELTMLEIAGKATRTKTSKNSFALLFHNAQTLNAAKTMRLQPEYWLYTSDN